MVLVLGPEAGPATRTLVKLSAAKLRSDTDAMIAADTAHLDEIAGDAKVVATRDNMSQSVHSHLVEIRESVLTVFGPAFVRELGFDGATPGDPVMVHSLAKQVLEKLASKSAAALTPVKRGLTLDLNAWLEPLTTGIEALEQAIKVVDDETREAGQTIGEAEDETGPAPTPESPTA